ncbi:class I SAM-dependent methyltransferase [Niveispirillum sp. SYP-B3756]|uniref:class I SAM-dependent methyltransferase n=1 Tax=Niveispirillum sp. SYP-B3756 TaxID=2662178 RepID=UPI001B3BBD0C|nr:class I SAM-dependent methyltransferase [Niveispirillum sp. SYP-B3756]
MDSAIRPFAPASAWVARFTPLIGAGARVLDVACGGGRHLRHFLDRGCAVTGVDIDLRGVADLEGRPWVTLRGLDLENGNPWPAELTGFDAIIVTHYLHRPLLPSLAGALRPGGFLIYETFAMGNQRHGRPSSPGFLLRNGELLGLAVAEGLQVVAFEQGEVSSPKAAVIQRLCARRPTGPAPDLQGDPEPVPLPPAG